MGPNIAVSGIAIVAAFAASFVLGFLWYGPIFGKTWAGLMGMDINQKPGPGVMKRAFACNITGTLLLCYVLTFSTNVWRPSVWGVGADDASSVYGFYSAFFTWIGFYIPIQLNKVAWEQRPWKLFFINAAHDIANLVIVAQILAHIR